MKSFTLICIWILVITIEIIEISYHVNVFEVISVPYKITDIQLPENL